MREKSSLGQQDIGSGELRVHFSILINKLLKKRLTPDV
jgi:hypothetical protein